MMRQLHSIKPKGMTQIPIEVHSHYLSGVDVADSWTALFHMVILEFRLLPSRGTVIP